MPGQRSRTVCSSRVSSETKSTRFPAASIASKTTESACGLRPPAMANWKVSGSKPRQTSLLIRVNAGTVRSDLPAASYGAGEFRVVRND